MDPIPTICNLMVKLGAALIFGLLTFRVKIVKDRETIGFLAGRVMLPLLVCKTIAVAEVASLEINAIICCTIGKLVILFIAVLGCLLIPRGKPWHSRLLSAGIFGYHVTSSNDFVIGLPIVDAFYPKNGVAQLTALVLVQYLFFQSVCLAMVEVGQAQAQINDHALCQGEDSYHVHRQSHGREVLRLISRIARSIFLNPLMVAVITALIYRVMMAIFAPERNAAEALPDTLLQLVNFFTEPYAFLALSLTGANLSSAFEPMDVVTHNSHDDVVYRVGVPVTLCMLKNIACPLVSAAASLMPCIQAVGHGTEDWHMFCFLYGCIPTSNAPLFVALQAGVHHEVVATAIFLGLILAVPMLIVFSSLFGNITSELLVDSIHWVQAVSGGISVLAASLVLGTCALWALEHKEWRRLPNLVIPGYAASCLVYGLCTVAFAANITLCKCALLDHLFACVQMQCRAWPIAMVFISTHASWVSARCAVAAALLLPLVLCAFVRPNTINELCLLSFSKEELMQTSVFTTIAFVFLSGLTLYGLQYRVVSHRDEEDGLSPLLRTDASSASLVGVADLEEPSSPRKRRTEAMWALACYENVPVILKSGLFGLRRSGGELFGSSGSLFGSSSSLFDFFGFGAESQGDKPRQAANARRRRRVDAGSRLKVTAVALSWKAALLLLLQMCNSWSVAEHGKIAQVHLQGMLVENFLEHGQGWLLLLLVWSLYDTPADLVLRRFRSSSVRWRQQRAESVDYYGKRTLVRERVKAAAA